MASAEGAVWAHTVEAAIELTELEGRHDRNRVSNLRTMMHNDEVEAEAFGHETRTIYASGEIDKSRNGRAISRCMSAGIRARHQIVDMIHSTVGQSRRGYRIAAF